MDLAAVGVGEVDSGIGERGGEFGEAVGGEFVVVIDLDEDITSAGLAGELFQFADVLGLAGVGDDSGLREIGMDLARVAVGDDHPFEVGEVWLAIERVRLGLHQTGSAADTQLKAQEAL